jgi:hypothetical protein
MAERPHPKRGEVWWVKPGKTAGAELQKKRPYVVISADAMGNVPVKIVVPLKTWQDKFADWDWVVRIEPTQANGLKRVEAAERRTPWRFDLRPEWSRLAVALPLRPQEHASDALLARPQPALPSLRALPAVEKS